jgi:uncharacterized protein YndB with AHSA1/START domain
VVPIELAETVEIARPVEEVFAFVGDRSHDGSWWSGVMGAHQPSARCGGLGATCVHETKLLGRVVQTTLEITEYDPPRAFTIRSPKGLTPFTAWCTLVPQQGGTRLEVRARLGAPGIFRLVKPLLIIPAMKRQLRGNLRRLKELLEGAAPLARASVAGAPRPLAGGAAARAREACTAHGARVRQPCTCP